jgi:hypothetical protein
MPEQWLHDVAAMDPAGLRQLRRRQAGTVTATAAAAVLAAGAGGWSGEPMWWLLSAILTGTTAVLLSIMARAAVWRSGYHTALADPYDVDAGLARLHTWVRQQDPPTRPGQSS